MLKTFIGRSLSTIRKGESGEIEIVDSGDRVTAEASGTRIESGKLVYVFETPEGKFLVGPWEV